MPRMNRMVVSDETAVYQVMSRTALDGSPLVDKDKVLEKERRRGFELSQSDRFRCRTRYFTDSGIIGSKAFVAENYLRSKHLFHSKHEKKPKLLLKTCEAQRT